MSDILEKTPNVMQLDSMKPKNSKIEKKQKRSILVSAKSHDAMLHGVYTRQSIKQAGKEISKSLSRDTIAQERRWSVDSGDIDANETLVSHALR